MLFVVAWVLGIPKFLLNSKMGGGRATVRASCGYKYLIDYLSGELRLIIFYEFAEFEHYE